MERKGVGKQNAGASSSGQLLTSEEKKIAKKIKMLYNPYCTLTEWEQKGGMEKRAGTVRMRGKFVCGIILMGVIAALLVILWLGYRLYYVPTDKIRRQDIAALSDGNYEEAVFSMFAVEGFEGERFAYFLGVDTVQADHKFVNLADIGNYLKQCLSANPDLTNIYIGLDPYRISSLYGHHTSLYARDYQRYLTKYVEEYADIQFTYLFPAYSVEFMRKLSEKEYEELVSSYRNLVNIYTAYDNVDIFFQGDEEWLIKNPGNYENSAECTTSIQQILVAYTLRDDRYLLTINNLEERLGRMTELVREPAEKWPDLSQWCIVFFGDSVLVYNEGSRSIPGIVEAFSGAQVYNCSHGGTSASENPEGILSFNQMIAHFLEQDVSGMETAPEYVQGLTKYMGEEHAGKQYCFVLNFGLNDYFKGYAVENDKDQFDTETYTGALRTGIRALQDVYPDSKILLLTPTYTSRFSGGTNKNSEEGGRLTDYVEAALRVAEEMNVYCLNNYADSGINKETSEKYLPDATHPNETGSFLLGRMILEYIRENMLEESP